MEQRPDLESGGLELEGSTPFTCTRPLWWNWHTRLTQNQVFPSSNLGRGIPQKVQKRPGYIWRYNNETKTEEKSQTDINLTAVGRSVMHRTFNSE